MWAKQSTAATLIVGPILDSTGAEYASAVIGDLSISKNGGTLTALAAAATLTVIANGQYTLVMTTGNLDTLGRAQITCNKSTYQMPPIGLVVVPAMVFDSLVLGTDFLQSDAMQFAGQTITAAAGVTMPSDPADQSLIIAATDALATLIGDVPTNAELATALGTSDDATLAAIAAEAVKTAAIKTKTDQLAFTSGKVNAELDSAVGTQITNIENASGYMLAVLAGACADPQTASETYAITVFGSTFTVDMAGQTSTGTRTAPTLTKV
jgi:hypothetical protein